MALQMTFSWKNFNDAFDFVKKVKGIKQVGQPKMVVKKAQNIGNFRGSYSMGYGHQAYPSHPIQSNLLISIGGPSRIIQHTLVLESQGALYSSTSRPSLDRAYFTCDGNRQFRRKS
ncbi:hypothetical protein FXO37_13027 [Capsicum annuum]|nr:hypothetical protein FXO37_13027 [Capsicum annuum]